MQFRSIKSLKLDITLVKWLPAAFEENYFGNLNNNENQHVIVNIKWTRLDLNLYIYWIGNTLSIEIQSGKPAKLAVSILSYDSLFAETCYNIFEIVFWELNNCEGLRQNADADGQMTDGFKCKMRKGKMQTDGCEGKCRRLKCGRTDVSVKGAEG